MKDFEMHACRHGIEVLLTPLGIFRSFLLICSISGTAWAEQSLPPISLAVERATAAITSNPQIKQTLAFLRDDDDQTLQDQVGLTEIPAPPFKEAARAREFASRLKKAGLNDVTIDSEGNVIGLYKGAGQGPLLAIVAHLDTVFPEGTDVRVKVDGKRYAAPGIYDDGRGLAAMLSLVRALKRSDLRPVGSLLFVGSVGEEELGNLRGVKALFRERKDIDGFLSLDGTHLDRVIHEAAGSRRFTFRFIGPGGHSFNAFGLPSAIHALGRAVARIADIKTPQSPKTTFTVGTVKGGTSVNAIAASAEFALDIRSTREEELRRVEEMAKRYANDAVEEENRRWAADAKVVLEIQLIGDRPAGVTPVDSIMVQAARKSLETVGVEVQKLSSGSTDANVAISMGIPALNVSAGGVGQGQHTLNEVYTAEKGWLGPQFLLVNALTLVGMEGVSSPLLQRQNTK